MHIFNGTIENQITGDFEDLSLTKWNGLTNKGFTDEDKKYHAVLT